MSTASQIETIPGASSMGLKSGKDDIWSRCLRRLSTSLRSTYLLETDPLPYEWRMGRKLWISTVVFLGAWNSTFGSSISTGAYGPISARFHVSETSLTLLVSMYLVGCAFGPLVFAPLSQVYGRRMCMIVGSSLLTVANVLCAVSQNWPMLLIFRLVAGFGSSAAMCISAGTLMDIYESPIVRGRIISGLMVATTIGALLAPIIANWSTSPSGSSWSLPFWIASAVSVSCTVTLFLTPETCHFVSQAPRLRKVLWEPFKLLFLEFILLYTCIYLGLLYSIYYLFFEMLPVMFVEVFGFRLQNTGVIFLPTAAGAVASFVVFWIQDVVFRRAESENKSWTKQPEFSRLPLACIGSPIISLSLFFMGYAVDRQYRLWVPMLLEACFGFGFLMVFMGLTNYVVDAYEASATLALSSSFVVRNILGAIIPVIVQPMYHNLGLEWSCYLLGFLSLAMVPVMLFLLMRGQWVRKRSPRCRTG